MCLKVLIKAFAPRSVQRYFKRLFWSCIFSKKNVTINTPFIYGTPNFGKNVGIYKDVQVIQNVNVGRYTYITDGSYINNCEIGNFCCIGRNVTINPFSHPYNNVSISPRLYGLIGSSEIYDDKPKKVIIENDVWLGNNSVIMQGVHIGNGAIVGAGAIVTKDVPDYAIVVGVPAKILKYRFELDKIKYLLQKKWWDWDESQLKQNKSFFEIDTAETDKIDE